MKDLLLAYMNFIENFSFKNAPFLSVHYPVTISLIYVILVYTLRFIMGVEKRDKASGSSEKKTFLGSFIRQISIWHNLFLVFLSISMFLGIIGAAIFRTEKYGAFKGLVCPSDSEEPTVLRGHMAFWIYIFHLSKYYELLDTLILVLSRKGAPLLNVYHHFIMVFVTWSWIVDDWLVGAWYCVFINSLIHTVMYYYFFETARGKKKSWKVLLTSGQITQLFSGFFLVSYWFWIRTEQGCTRGYNAALFSHLSNGTLILLFIQFFVSSYLFPKPSPKEKEK